MISPCIALAGNIDLLIAVSDNILTADIILIPAYRDRLFSVTEEAGLSEGASEEEGGSETEELSELEEGFSDGILLDELELDTGAEELLDAG